MASGAFPDQCLIVSSQVLLRCSFNFTNTSLADPSCLTTVYDSIADMERLGTGGLVAKDNSLQRAKTEEAVLCRSFVNMNSLLEVECK